MSNIPETPDDTKLGVRHFYGQWFKLAFLGAWGVMGDVCTVAGVILAGIADKKPDWASPSLIEILNSLGGWKIPLLAFSSVLLVRVILAPYWVWKKQRDRAQELQDQLSEYDETPVFPIVEMPSNGEPIRVKLINKGKDEEPIESACLYLCDNEKSEPFRLTSGEDDKALPLTMARKTKHYVTFDICGAHCIQWGVKSVFAVVNLQDGRQREGDRFTIRNSAPLDELLVPPVEHEPGRTFEQSMVRHKRIYKVGDAYRLAWIRSIDATAVNRLRDLNDAQIRELVDASEVRQLLTTLELIEIPHPFEHGEDADSILRFYKSIPTRYSIGGIMEWNAAYDKWFAPSTPHSPAPNTATSTPEPAS